MKPLSVSLIIPHWNTPKSLEKLLSQVTDQPGIETIVVDNHSDQPLDFIQKKFSNVSFIFNAMNRGFAAACNQGAAIARNDWLFFLNPDVEVSSNDIQSMIEYAEQKKLDALSPTPQDSAYSQPLPTLGNLLVEYSPLKRMVGIDSPRKTLTGGALMIRTEVLRSLGGWDERFFLWFEDSDITQRLYEGHYRVGWYPHTINHIGGKALKKLPKQTQRDIFFHSLNLYSQKHFSNLAQLILKIVTRRFSTRKTLPILQNGVCLVVPNMHQKILKSFFEKNWTLLSPHVKNGWLELVVVSSALKAKQLWKYRQEYPGVRFISLDNNRGFAATVNLGWSPVVTAWMGTINDDVVLNKGWLQACLALPSTLDKVGSINPIITTHQGDIESAGIKVLPIGKAQPITDIPQEQFTQTDATNGAAVIYNHEALEEVGMFDERFGSYLEDIDLSLRLKKAGWKNVVCSGTKIVHLGHQTSQKMGRYKRWLDFKNWWRVVFKNWPVEWWFTYGGQILLERTRNLWGVLKW